MDPDFNNANPGLCPIGALKITLPIRQLQLFIDMWKHSQLDANKINVSYDVNVRLKRNFHNPEIGCERKSFQTFVSDSIWTICMENDEICFSVSKLSPQTGPYQHVECSIAEVVKFRFNDSCVIQKKTLNEKEFSSLFSKDAQKEVNSEIRMYGAHSVVHYNDESSCSGDNGSTQDCEDKIHSNNKAHFDGRKKPFKDRITDGNKSMPFQDTKSESDTESMDDEENKLVIDIQHASSNKNTTPVDNRFDKKHAQTVSGIDIDKSDIVVSKPSEGQISPAVISKAIDKESRAVVDMSSGTLEVSGKSDMEKKKMMVIEIMDNEMEIIEIDNNDNDNCRDKNVDKKDKDEEKNEVGEYQDDEVVKEEEEKEKEHHEEVKKNHEWEEVEGEEEEGQDNCKEAEGEKELRQDKSKEVGEVKNNVLYVKHKSTHTSLSNPAVGGSNSNSERVPEKKDTTSMQSFDKFPLSECFEEEFECDVWNDDLMNVVMMDIVTEAMNNKTKDEFKPKGQGLQSRPQIQKHVENEHINSGGKTDAGGKSKAHSCSERTYDDEILSQVSQNQTDVAKMQSWYNHDQNRIGHKQLEKGDSPISHNYPCQKDGNDIEWIKIEINPDFREIAVETVHDGAPNEERNSRNQNNSSENENCDCSSVDLSKVKTEPMDDYESTGARSGSDCADSAHLASALTYNKISDFSNTRKEMSTMASLVANTTAAARKDVTGKEINLVKNTTKNFRFQDISPLPQTAQTSQSIRAPPLSVQTSQCISLPLTAQTSQCISTPPLTAQTSQCVSAPPWTAQTSQCISTPPLTAQISQCISTPPLTAQTSQCISAPPWTAQTSQCISTPPLTAQTSQCISTPPLTAQTSQCISAPRLTAQTSHCISTPPLTALASKNFSASQLLVQASQSISIPRLTAHASQGISTPPLTAQSSQGISNPPVTVLASQGISNLPLTTQAYQGISTPPLSAQASQGISTPQLTEQTITKTSFKLPTILQRRNMPMKVVPIEKSAPPEGLQISPVMYKCIPVRGLILDQSQTSKQGPNPSNSPLHQHLQMSFSAKESARPSFSDEPLKIISSSGLQLRPSVHCGVDKDSSFASVQNSQMKSALSSLHLVKSSHPFDKTSHPLDKTSDPLDKTSHPFDKTSHPLDKTSDPLDKINHPFDKTRHPFDKTSHPLDNTRHPFDEISHPIDKTSHAFDKTSDPIYKSTSNSCFSMKPKDAATVATFGSKANKPSSVSMPVSVSMPTSVSMLNSVSMPVSVSMPTSVSMLNSVSMPDIHSIRSCSSSFMIMKKTPQDICPDVEQIINSEKDVELVWDNLSQIGDQSKILGLVWASGLQGETGHGNDSNPASDGKSQKESYVKEKTALPSDPKTYDLEKESCNNTSCSSTRLTSAKNTLLKTYGPKSHQVKKGKSDRKRPSSERPLAGINISKMECFWSKKRRTIFTGTITSFGKIMEKLADRDLDYQIHDNDRFVECINCKEIFISEQDFMYHMVDFEIYINKSSCRCKCCKQRFLNHELLNSHFQLHSVFKNKNGNEINLDREYECKHCDELFCTHRMKLEHDLMEHNLGQVHANMCSECSRAFPNRIWLHMHYKLCCPSQQERLPLLSFRCQYCGSEFNEEGHRNHHEESCMKVSIHHCPYCGIAMAKLLPMAFHISFVHYKVKMICCTENDCSLKFESPFRQMCHKVVDHQAPYVVHQLEESQPLFHCQLCRRAIYSVLELYDHLSARCRWPHGKWFSCKVCELKFLSHKAVACHTCCVHPVEEL